MTGDPERGENTGQSRLRRSVIAAEPLAEPASKSACSDSGTLLADAASVLGQELARSGALALRLLLQAWSKRRSALL